MRKLSDLNQFQKWLIESLDNDSINNIIGFSSLRNDTDCPGINGTEDEKKHYLKTRITKERFVYILRRLVVKNPKYGFIKIVKSIQRPELRERMENYVKGFGILDVTLSTFEAKSIDKFTCQVILDYIDNNRGLFIESVREFLLQRSEERDEEKKNKKNCSYKKQEQASSKFTEEDSPIPLEKVINLQQGEPAENSWAAGGGISPGVEQQHSSHQIEKKEDNSRTDIYDDLIKSSNMLIQNINSFTDEEVMQVKKSVCQMLEVINRDLEKREERKTFQIRINAIMERINPQKYHSALTYMGIKPWNISEQVIESIAVEKGLMFLEENVNRLESILSDANEKVDVVKQNLDISATQYLSDAREHIQRIVQRIFNKDEQPKKIECEADIGYDKNEFDNGTELTSRHDKDGLNNKQSDLFSENIAYSIDETGLKTEIPKHSIVETDLKTETLNHSIKQTASAIEKINGQPDIEEKEEQFAQTSASKGDTVEKIMHLPGLKSDEGNTYIEDIHTNIITSDEKTCNAKDPQKETCGKGKSIQDSEKRYVDMAVGFLQQNKINYLYWISVEAEKNGQAIVFPSWLALCISVIVGAENFESEEKDLITNYVSHKKPLIKLIADSLKIGTEYAAFLLAVISTRATLIAPETGTIEWLETSLGNLGHFGEKLYDIFSEVREFVRSGAIYSSIGLNKELGKAEWREVAQETSKRVIRFVDEIKARKFSYAPASYFINRVFDNNSEIAKAYDIVSNCKYEESGFVHYIIDNLLSDSKNIQTYIIDSINRLMRDEYNMKKIKVQGNVLDMLVRRMQELRDMFETWLTVVSDGKNSEISSESNWNIARTKELNKSLREKWNQVRKAFKVNKSASAMEKAIYSFCKGVLEEMIANTFCPILLGENWFNNTGFEDLVPLWKKVLGYPLLFVDYPEINDYGNFNPLSSALRDRKYMEYLQSNNTLSDMFERHLNNSDFNAANLCLAYLKAQGKNTDILVKRYAEREYEAKASIKTAISSLEQNIIKAYIDHIISEDEYLMLTGELNSTEKESVDDNRVAGDLYRSLKKLEWIRTELQRIKTDREKSLDNNISSMEIEVNKKQEILDTNSVEFIRRYLNLGRESLRKGEFGLADEYLHFAEKALYNGEFIEYVFEEDHRSYVKEFVEVIHDLGKHLEEDRHSIIQIFRTIETGKSNTKIAKILNNLSNVPGSRRHEVKEGLEAWRDIKENFKPVLDRPYQQKLCNLFSYLGFNVTQPNIRNCKSSSMHLSFTINMVGNLSPLADFGSSCNGKYNVIVFSGRPNSMSMIQTICELGLQNNSPIIIFLGRMTLKQREEWMDACKSERLTAMVVDELLVYYLASIRENRLPAAISCGAAWSNVMPYRSFGIIPKEIFKGRKEMIQSLGRPEGSCIVYGGRQFGKSVLLHMVEQDFNKPERNEYVIYDDIKQIGDPNGIRQVSEIWKLMYERMVTVGFLPRQATVYNDPDAISELIISKLLKDKDSRIIVLFDEADNFMEADAQNNFLDISRLRRIMDTTQRRFKVVFCGLHSVLRHISYPNDPLKRQDKNHPFAQMMALPMNVGPLDPASAQQLIIEPMTAIGFDFSSDESRKAVYKILSYTNYHPALIQHFCAELINDIRKDKKRLPYSITVANVETVYRKTEIRNFIKDRFNWTLTLDPRYEAIVYSMVYSQINDRDGYRKVFSPKEVYDMVTYYWPDGFENMGTEDITSILKELEGLGIIIVSNGTYRLRNANVVRALGTEEEITNSLLQLMNKPAPTRIDDTDRIRIKLGDGKPSSLTVRQIGDLIRPSKSGVSLVFGSDALGINNISNILKYINDHNGSIYLENISSKLKYLDKFKHFIESRVKEKCSIGKQLVFYCYISKKKKNFSILELLKYLTKFISIQQDRNHITRIILIFDSNATYQWMKEKWKNGWEEKEPEYLADSVIILKKWDPRALSKFLCDNDIVCNEETAKKIIEITGGWSALIDRMLQEIDITRLAMQPEPLLEAKKIIDELKRPDAELISDFINELGFKHIDGSAEIYNLASVYGPVSMEDILEECLSKGIGENSIKASVMAMVMLRLLKENKQGEYDENIAVDGIRVI